MSLIRVLVVEDFLPFQRVIRSTLGKSSDFLIVGEVSDGAEAVRKAEELHPELILMDFGLPTLNGIEATQRIRALSPESKIVFVTMESSADVVQEALSLGASGYLLKTTVASELLAAIEEVMSGKRYIGSGL